MKTEIQLQVNGFAHNLHIEPHWTLLDVLRNEIGVCVSYTPHTNN